MIVFPALAGVTYVAVSYWGGLVGAITAGALWGIWLLLLGFRAADKGGPQPPDV